MDVNTTRNLKKLRQLARKCIKACRDHYGLSDHFHCFPELKIINDDNELLSGEFRDDHLEIMINLASIYNEEDLMKTVCHEYLHYLQDPDVFEKYREEYDYYDNPFEIEAYHREHEILNFI